MADIFREIDEELQQDRAAKLWQRYGGWVLAVAVGVVLAVAGNVFWTRYTADRQAGRGDRYEAAAPLAAAARDRSRGVRAARVAPARG